MYFFSNVTKKSKSSNNGWDNSYGTASTLSCNYSKVEKIIQGKDNKQFLTCAWVQFPSGTTILKTDQITLPDNTTAPIASIYNVTDPVGNAVCVEVWLGEEIKGGF